MKTFNLFLLTLIIHIHLCTYAQGINPTVLAQIESIREGYVFGEGSWLINPSKDTVAFTDLTGSWTILDYWSAGCRPCIEAFPLLEEISAMGQVKIIGINVDKDFGRFEKYHKKYDIKYPDFFAGFTLTNPLMLANVHITENEDGVSKLVTLTPHYILLDPDGVIVNKNLPKPGSKEFQQILINIKE